MIHPEGARRLLCDGRLQTVVSDHTGQAVGIGRMARTSSPWILRRLRWRDRGCTFPGCELRRFLHAHHIRHWIEGGPTDLDNLVLVCSPGTTSWSTNMGGGSGWGHPGSPIGPGPTGAGSGRI